MKILIAGDFAPVGRIAQEIKQGKSIELFSSFTSLIKESDYSVVNLEAPLCNSASTKIIKIGPHLSALPESIPTLKKVGFDAVTLANNHIMDFGNAGMEFTIRSLKEHELDFMGGGMNLSDATRIHLKTLGNVRIAFINVCENEFSIAQDNKAGAAPLNPVTNYYRIKEARNIADIVLMIIHGGNEYYQLPSPRMQELYRFFIDAGADAVINHHQHCYSGYEFYKERPIVYGLGNFMFDEKNNRTTWNTGHIAIIDINTNHDISLDLVPYVQCLEKAGLREMTQEELSDYHETIKKLNTTIADAQQLEKQFELFKKKKEGAIIGVFSSWPSEYARAAAARKYLPHLLAPQKLASMYDYINCESQRDITLGVINNMLKKR